MTVPGADDYSDIRTGQVITKAQQAEGYNNLILNLVNFLQPVNLYGEVSSAKPLVHCRQGHGRTGTTVTILTRVL